ncbi:MAG TPA: diacylglycerol kinase family protein [Thermoanaerobaculia bacterium]|jgi:diacylglycerol kinase family enzyme
MKVSLLHNRDAGDGFRLGEVRRVIEAAGHEVVHDLEAGSDPVPILPSDVDLLAVAGGDGTVRKAVDAFEGARRPFAILPFGTANNIARVLGYDGPLDALPRRWANGRRMAFDVGVARGKWGERRFLEGVGIRLIPEFLRTAKERLEENGDGDAGAQLELSRRVFRETLALLKPQRCALTVDGDRLEGEFLFVEVLNIGAIGPRLSILPEADPSDGFLDLVTAGEEGRDELLALLDENPSGGRPALPTRRVRRVEMLDWGSLHIDGKIEAGDDGAVSVGVEPGRVEFLV